MMTEIEQRGVQSRGSSAAGREVGNCLWIFGLELLTLAGTECDPFSSAAVTLTAVLQLEDLRFLIAGERSLQKLKRAPLWEAASWVVGTVLSRLEGYAGDPAVDPVLEAARKAEARLKA